MITVESLVSINIYFKIPERENFTIIYLLIVVNLITLTFANQKLLIVKIEFIDKGC